MSQDGSQYKDTILLPKTDFPMKADLNVREPQIIAKWKSEDIYGKMIERRAGQALFTMPDGPPYANGAIHMGHTLNKCLKDITLKYRNISGKKAVFIPGWDCHGLPIEHKVLKDLGDKKDHAPKQIRELCRKEALKWVSSQREEFIRLGILADWENPYLTLQPAYEAEEVRELARILKNKILYRGLKPVYWCWALQTALAEAEIEYQDKQSPSIYVKFPFTPTNVKLDKPSYALIWTTTPWTIPSNQGIALHPELDYAFFSTGTEYWLIARALKESVEKETGATLTETGKVFKGTDFENQKAKHPFYDRDSLMILGEHVGLDAGTGLVHTAPGHGLDDYIVGLKYGLKVMSPVNEKGEFTNEVPEYAGMHVLKKANEPIVERLREAGKLAGFKTITHSYPHCWRSKTPLIFRATSQWFIRMDDPEHNVRAMALKAIEKDIKFVPDWGIKRLTAMIESRPDWCVSRQRNWGVPIPAFFCGKCGHTHMTEEVLYKVADRMEEGGGIDAYFDASVSDLIGDELCPNCGALDWSKSTDILDVWFDSGVCHAAVQVRRDGLNTPSDIYLEGSDQHRGWFQTSLLSSIASKGHPPFKALVTHNFVNDEHGRKMSKSLGNYVNPMDLVKQSGAELLRLWTASQDYGQDMNFSMEGFKRISEAYRRLRNTFRFMLGNVNDFDAKKDALPYAQMMPIDQWALHKFAELITATQAAYENYEYFKVYHLLNNYFTVDLSAHYLDILKDRLYTWKANGPARRSAQTVIHEITQGLMSIMAPITSFLSEEVHSHFPGKQDESVFLLGFPVAKKEWTNAALAQDYDKLFALRETVSKKLEEMRQSKTIGASLEARVELAASGEDFKLLSRYQDFLCEFFIVSQVEVTEGTTQINVSKARGEKCPRCWYYSEHIGTHPDHPLLCQKCTGALT